MVISGEDPGFLCVSRRWKVVSRVSRLIMVVARRGSILKLPRQHHTLRSPEGEVLLQFIENGVAFMHSLCRQPGGWVGAQLMHQ